jgi:hypothetical protein
MSDEPSLEKTIAAAAGASNISGHEIVKVGVDKGMLALEELQTTITETHRVLADAEQALHNPNLSDIHRKLLIAQLQNFTDGIKALLEEPPA